MRISDWSSDVCSSDLAYRAAFFDRHHSEMGQVVDDAWLLDHDASGDFVRDHFAVPGAETGTDKALRLDTTVMLVDDPVKRVDNMTMAWGLEARVPFLDHALGELAAARPPELKLAQGGKGGRTWAARPVIPAQGSDQRGRERLGEQEGAEGGV